MKIFKGMCASEKNEWDFVLPVPFPETQYDDDDGFSAARLAQIIHQEGMSADSIKKYLDQYGLESVRDDINGHNVDTAPIFYAVARNDLRLLRLLIDFGADVHATHAPSGTPLLAFAIICGETLQTDTTAVVCTLLSRGVSPKLIPQALFSPYMSDVDDLDPAGALSHEDDDTDASEPTSWCSHAVRAKLVRSLHLSHRYSLDKALRMKPPGPRRRQIVQRKNAQGVLEFPYFLIGQRPASDLLVETLIAHLTWPDKKRPLVLCFAGPSGHGKTELARQLGHFLSMDLEVVDCTTMNREEDLFGPKKPYQGWEKGSPVNNFLVSHAGKRCIVFMDEFEKTKEEVHHSLLLPFDNGVHRDRRNDSQTYDCSNTIWIVATNALDNTIEDFYRPGGPLDSDDEAERSRAVRELSGRLQKSFLSRFGAPMTGRISGFVPFLPFSTGEQAVITHKLLLELAKEMRLPVNLSQGPEERLVGDMRLVIRNDRSLCAKLAREYYHRHLGARSLKAAAQKAKHIVLNACAYLEIQEEIHEQNELLVCELDYEDEEFVGRFLKKRK